MGYESRIYIVKKTGIPGYRYPDKEWAEVLMTFNLVRVSVAMERWLRKQKPTDCYIYTDDGNTEIVEDRVGDPLREIDFVDLKYNLLKEIEMSDYQKQKDSLRILAENVLTNLIIIHGFDCDDVVCLHYGY